MTWLEAFKKDHPSLSEEFIMDEFCPVDGLLGRCPEFDGEVDCEKCGRRQMPEDGEAGPDR